MTAPFVSILEGHVLDRIKELPDRSVQMILTSPPYWGLRDYSRCGCAIAQLGVGGGDNRDERGIRIREPVGTGTSGEINYRESIPDPDCHKCHGTGKDDSLTVDWGDWRGQLGLEPTIDLYVKHIVAVFREVRRVLRDDGTLWLNMGDCYSIGTDAPRNKSTSTTGGHVPAGWSNREEPMRRDAGLKPKDMVGMPWRVAFALQADGWWLRSDIIWAKPNPMPESVTDRPTKSHEYMFLMTKAATYFYDADAVREPTSPSTLARARYHYPNAIDNPDYASKHADGDFRRFPIQGQIQGKRARSQNRRYIGFNARWDAQTPTPKHAAADKDTRSKTGFGHDTGWGADDQAMYLAAGRNLRTVWTIPTQPYKDAHFATFPEALVEPCIKAGTSERGACPTCGAPWKREVEVIRSFESASGKAGNVPTGKSPEGVQGGGDVLDVRLGPTTITKTLGFMPTCSHETEPVPCVVLDPFAGSGTTGEVARYLGRSAILVEIKGEYVALTRERTRLNHVALDTFPEHTHAPP